MKIDTVESMSIYDWGRRNYFYRDYIAIMVASNNKYSQFWISNSYLVNVNCFTRFYSVDVKIIR